ncbi:MAG: efflux RND transporter permease subunit [Bacteroidota bacterium]|nr:efflux RND transporter permease subunit [Candidatus Kapabacteria bacterium]MDW8219373.1 efflux RND transporter permease subunit [Bacteroidota bacterium]
MNLPTLSLRRPVLAIVMSLVIMLFGVMGYTLLSVREFPAIDPPVITVRTVYSGANPEIVESQITEPLEKAINGIQGVRTISSNSALGVSIITVEFNIESDLEQAANDVRDKVSQAQRQLPQDIDAPPVVTKADASGDPVIFMPVQSRSMNIMQLSAYAENVLQERLQTIPGVSQVLIFGMKRYAMRLWIDPVRLAAYNLTIQDIQEALNRENVELPSGKIYGYQTELTVKTFGRLEHEEDFNNLILRQTDNRIIRFRDVGRAELGPENEETSLRRNNSPGVSVAIIPQPGANVVNIADEFYRRFEIIKRELPPDMMIDIGIDRSRPIRASIAEVKETLAIAFSLVVIVIFLFFRDWRIALRPLIDIPVSLMGAFFIMYVFGFSINILTLLAIVLATGLVVDDGIVVTENIYKKIEQGMPPLEAAKTGSTEIVFAVISTSITLAAVFLPVIFLQGFVGALFREFGIVIASSVLISAFVSLTLTPVLSAKLSANAQRRSRFYAMTEPFYQWLEHSYRRTLEKFLHHRVWAVGIVLVSFGLIYLFATILKSELAPLEDKGFIRMPMTAPEGTSFDAMEQIIATAAQFVIDSVPEHRMVFGITAGGGSTGAVNAGFVSILLKDSKERARTQMQIAEYIGKHMRSFNAARAIPVQEQTISTGFASGLSLPVQFVIQNLDFEKLKSKLPEFLEEAQKDPTFQAVDVNLKFNKPELTVSIDRLKATELGVSVRDISNTLQLALSNRRFGYFLMNGKQYQVIGQVERNDRNRPSALQGFYVRNSRGQLIPLDNLVYFNEVSSPPQIFHYNRYKSATVSASLAPGKTVGEGIKAMQAIAERVLDDSFTTSLAGASRDFAESSSNTAYAFVVALLLIYLILAAQFESFRDPLIIMLTVPLAVLGALLSLWAFNQTLNIFSQIGIIMLIGLVTKNGILIVEFSNHLRSEGKSLHDAALEGASARLRPILMTSLVTAIGALPIALALGAASQSRVPLGIVVVGGVLFSLMLTLYVIPAMYTYLASRVAPALEQNKSTTSVVQGYAVKQHHTTEQESTNGSAKKPVIEETV